MECEIYDYPTRILVHSETDGEASYLVDLCAFPYAKDKRGDSLFNGACQCKSFIFRCEPQLKKPENKGKVFRCKHIRHARDNALDYLLPFMCKADPNNPEEH